MEWAPIEEFPGYSVSTDGRVRNEGTGRVLALLRNQTGVTHVGLVRDGTQYKRAVSKLVADAFLDPPPHDTFDTPIHLDGDRSNNNVENLEWRPRWFALKYHKQFEQELHRDVHRPIVETKTGEVFENSWEAAVRYGLLHLEVTMACINRTYVWPTYQEFRHLEE